MKSFGKELTTLKAFASLDLHKSNLACVTFETVFCLVVASSLAQTHPVVHIAAMLA